MKENKFRGKTTEGKWLYGSLINNAFFVERTNVPVCYIFDNEYDDYGSWEDIAEILDECEVLNETVGQYIGVNDNTGKEIYKGDIVELPRCNNTRAIVEEFGVGYILRETDGSGFIRFSDEPNPFNFKVIGNIYENPELLELVY